MRTAKSNPAGLSTTQSNRRTPVENAFCFAFTRALLWVSFVLALVSSAAAQTQNDLFDNWVLQDIRLTVRPDDWAQFKENYWSNDYIAGDLSWRGTDIKNIGIRHRGTGSRSGTKPYLGLKFDQYVKGQQFLGLSNLRLKNAINDPSFLREILGMDFFRRMDLPAPRESYARLYVNEEYSGLYWIVEEIDNSFLDRVFGEHNGCLYNYNLVDEYHFEYLGDDPGQYAPDRFEPKSCPADTDPAALINMIRTMNLASNDAFIAQISQFLDLNRFLRYLAVEQFPANFDFLLGSAGMNNFYLYRFAGTERFEFIPWDLDDTFYDSQQSLWFGVDTNVLTRRICEYPEITAAYQDAARMVALEAGGSGGWLDEELNRFYALIYQAAVEDPVKPVDNAAFEEAVNAVREFVHGRKEYVIAHVGPLPAPVVASGGVVNSASYTPALTAGSIGSIFGRHLAYTSVTATELPLPKMIDKTVVRVNGMPVPLLSISPSQVNFQVPWEFSGQAEVSLVLTVDGVSTAAQRVNLMPMSPGLFSLKGNQGAILIAGTGEFAAPSPTATGIAARPARRGESIFIYSTGLGPVTSQPPSGETPPAGLCTSTTTPAVTIGGVSAAVTFSGLAPESAGLYVLDVQVPENAPPGDAVPVVITLGGATSNTVTMAVQ
ncbi:MAG: CotH kinase family protein [Acidobacteria bacterium]|nr:CotH kinase family protein [Acidobacteriota bacterium]